MASPWNNYKAPNRVGCEEFGSDMLNGSYDPIITTTVTFSGAPATANQTNVVNCGGRNEITMLVDIAGGTADAQVWGFQRQAGSTGTWFLIASEEVYEGGANVFRIALASRFEKVALGMTSLDGSPTYHGWLAG